MRTDAKKIAALALTVILASGCKRNELCYDHPHGELHVQVDWCNLRPGQMQPEGVRITFYGKTDGAECGTAYREACGGKANVGDGNYFVLVYNSDTERVEFCNTDDYGKAEACLSLKTRQAYRNSPAVTKGSVNGIYYPDSPGISPQTRGEDLVGEADHCLYVYSGEADVTVQARKCRDTLTVAPRSCTYPITLAIPVSKNISNVQSCRGSISGIPRSLNLSTRQPSAETATVIFDMEKEGDAFVHSFCVFGSKDPAQATWPATRADGAPVHILTVEFLLVDNSVQTITIPITEPITPDAGVAIPPDTPDVEIPDVKPAEGGGMDPGLGDWGEEEIIPLQ